MIAVLVSSLPTNENAHRQTRHHLNEVWIHPNSTTEKMELLIISSMGDEEPKGQGEKSSIIIIIAYRKVNVMPLRSS